MSLLYTPVYPGDAFHTPEGSTALVNESVTSIALQNTPNYALITTAAAHGFTAATSVAGIQTVSPTQYITFSGVTGVTGLNDSLWTIAAVPSTTTLLIFCTLTGTPAGTILLLPCFALSAGLHNVLTGANAIVRYNPDGNGVPNNPSVNPSVTGATWRTLVPVSAAAASVYFPGNGQTVIQCSTANAGTTVWSKIGGAS